MKTFLTFLFAAFICSQANSQIIITGYMNHPFGNEDDNLEYIQLKATEDIDFSARFFSVVTCSNRSNENPNAGNAPDNGWATGGYRTYKFDLTKGKVANGDFFYLGGTAKLINGAGSTSIADAKWMRSIDYMNTDGDGFGTARAESVNLSPSIAKTGLMPNNSSPGGIAVFKGNKIKENTVPIDVIFFKAVNGKVFNTSAAKGYRVATNDHYNQDEAPFFLQGSNTYSIPYATAGKFIKLNGNFDVVKKQWITPREPSYILLSSTSQLNQIE